MGEKNALGRWDNRRLSDRIESAAELAVRQGRSDMAARLHKAREILRKKEAKMPRRRLGDWLSFVEYGSYDQETVTWR